MTSTPPELHDNLSSFRMTSMALDGRLRLKDDVFGSSMFFTELRWHFMHNLKMKSRVTLARGPLQSSGDLYDVRPGSEFTPTVPGLFT